MRGSPCAIPRTAFHAGGQCSNPGGLKTESLLEGGLWGVATGTQLVFAPDPGKTDLKSRCRPNPAPRRVGEGEKMTAAKAGWFEWRGKLSCHADNACQSGPRFKAWNSIPPEHVIDPRGVYCSYPDLLGFSPLAAVTFRHASPPAPSPSTFRLVFLTRPESARVAARSGPGQPPHRSPSPQSAEHPDPRAPPQPPRAS